MSYNELYTYNKGIVQVDREKICKMFSTGKTLVAVPSNDSKVRSNLAGGAKVLFSGGRGHTMGSSIFC